MVHLTTALDPASAVPLYEQLYESLAAEMRSGAIPAGTRMPGKRRLAAELSVSVNTVDAAYQMLAAEGYLDENGELLWPYSGMDVYGEWASGLTLVDGDGKEVFPGMQEEYGFVYGCNGHGDNWAENLFPYRESYPAEMWLAPMENGTADMTKAVRVR